MPKTKERNREYMRTKRASAGVNKFTVVGVNAEPSEPVPAEPIGVNTEPASPKRRKPLDQMKAWLAGLPDTDGCIEWPFKHDDAGPYLMAAGKRNDAARMVCWISRDEAPGKRRHVHSCGNLWCCNPNHLSWTQPGAMPPTPPMPRASVIISLPEPIIKGLGPKGRNSSFGLMETEPPPFAFTPDDIASIRHAMVAIEAEPVEQDNFGGTRMRIPSAGGVQETTCIPLETAIEPDQAKFSSGRMPVTAPDGKERETLCLPDRPEPASRLAAIMADPILHDPYFFGMPIRPAPEPILSDDDWASTLEAEARCRHRASAAKIGARR